MPEKKYALALCELFQPAVHGFDAHSSPDIHGHYFVYELLDLTEFYNVEEFAAVQEMLAQQQQQQQQRPMQLEIVEYKILMPGGEMVALIKTYWLRLVQRRWKKIYQARKRLLIKRQHIHALQYRAQHGKWPRALHVWPT
jgi:hypothetical protein